MRWEQVTPPLQEPVSRTFFVEHSRLDDVTDEPTTVDHYVMAARVDVEEFTARQLITATWEFYLDRFPYSSGVIVLPRPPLQAVESITYTDTAGASQTLAVSDYVVDSTGPGPGRIIPAEGLRWPDTARTLSAVTVRFTAGYGLDGDDCPATLIQAILFQAGHLYEHRETVAIGPEPREVPMTVRRMLEPYRVRWFA